MHACRDAEGTYSKRELYMPSASRRRPIVRAMLCVLAPSRAASLAEACWARWLSRWPERQPLSPATAQQQWTKPQEVDQLAVEGVPLYDDTEIQTTRSCKRRFATFCGSKTDRCRCE